MVIVACIALPNRLLMHLPYTLERVEVIIAAQAHPSNALTVKSIWPAWAKGSQHE